MPLDLNALYCATRLIGDSRETIGTGFFLTVQSESNPKLRHPYLVTAHHVIAGQTDVCVRIADAWTDGSLAPPLPVTGWSQPVPNVDLAVAPFAPSRFMGIALEDQVIEDRRTYRPQELFPGSPIHYIGVFVPLDRVMARSGTIGALDQTNLPLGGYDYPAHLVDCRSYGGFSGSPCFVEMSYAALEPTDVLPHPLPEQVSQVADLHHLSMLCGMFTAHVTDEDDPGNADNTVSRYGVGVMLRSDEIREALMTDELRADRRRNDAAHMAARAAEGPGLENVSQRGKEVAEERQSQPR
jgi:hypothetical protein